MKQVFPAIGPDFAHDALEGRVILHEALMICEISYEGLYFHTSGDANALFDYVEECLSETGEPLWFFLVNTKDYKIDGDAWFAFTKRGMDMKEYHAMGIAHYDTSEFNRNYIERVKGTDQHDKTNFGSRDEAVAYLKSLPSKRRERLFHTPNYMKPDIHRRVSFDRENDICELDLTDLSYEHSRDVNDVFNWIEELLRQTRQKWWFLMNYNGTRIQSPAWVQFDARRRSFHDTFSLGSVRFAMGSETETDIRLRHETRGIRPNIRNTRAEALERLNEMKLESGS
ncbi:hypothetical protein [Marivivens aquimaris]|uniref:hypothetical protein n=1 Tax=Marivivens aquimaris TaxID=2774876 RepID=UPI001881639A|nr:hypothetical protein [Marivivens aquimaris]